MQPRYWQPGAYAGLKENGRVRPVILQLLGLWLVAMAAIIAFPSGSPGKWGAFRYAVIRRTHLSPGTHTTLLVIAGVVATAGVALVILGFRRAQLANLVSPKS